MKENEDYEFIPLDTENDAWGIRFLSGQFVETVIKFGVLKLIEETENISYSFDIISSPDSQLTTDNEDLQVVAAEVLSTILEENYASQS